MVISLLAVMMSYSFVAGLPDEMMVELSTDSVSLPQLTLDGSVMIRFIGRPTPETSFMIVPSPSWKV